MTQITNTTMPPLAFSCQQLGLQLGGVEILAEIDLSLHCGKVHAIIGPNGGGKTSLLRCLLGQMPHIGHIESAFDGTATVGYVPQFLDLDKTLPITVNDFMSMVCQAYRPAFLSMDKSTAKVVEQALDNVGLTGKGRTRLGLLSGGELQRVLFAQALIPNPQLLVLDEPMNSLDQVGAATFTALIEEMARKGVTVLWVAHEIQQVKEKADTVSGINTRLCFHGDPQQVLHTTDLTELFRENAA